MTVSAYRERMFAQLAAIILPVVGCALIGWGWARSGMPFEREFLTRLVMNFGAPCLILRGVANLEPGGSGFFLLLGISVLVLLLVAVSGWVILRVAGSSPRNFLPPVVFGNVGNLGLPLCLFAFGTEGLGLAVAFFLTAAFCQFVLVPLFQSRESVGFTILRTPVIYASVIAVFLLLMEWELPVWLGNTVELISGLTIPLMIIALGHALGTFGVRRPGIAIGLSLMRLGLGFAAGLLVVWLFELEGVMRGVVLIEATMPAAVFNYLMAARYDRAPADVAGAIVVSTLLSLATLPLLLSYALAGI